MSKLLDEIKSTITFEMYENGADDNQLFKVIKYLIKKHEITAEQLKHEFERQVFNLDIEDEDDKWEAMAKELNK